jgi:hypothetical protein
MKTTISKDNPQFKTRTSPQTTELFTPRATLCAIGVKLRAMKIFEDDIVARVIVWLLLQPGLCFSGVSAFMNIVSLYPIKTGVSG